VSEEPKFPDVVPDRRGGREQRDQEQETASDQRSGEERRRQPDRRGVHLTFTFNGPAAVEELRKWLDANCEHPWALDVPDMETVAKWGRFRVRFESENDRAKLGKMLAVYWPSWM